MISAGRVLIMPRGAYNPLATYEMLDIVSYNGSSYIAKGTTTGNLPTDTTYWQLSAYGGQAANIAGNFAELESSSVATAIHYVDDIFVDENSQLMKATQTINIGDTIDANVNCAPTTVEALIAYLSSYVDSLDSLNKKIQGAIEIAAQTDLHSLAIGEYYKKQTTFYVTNGPTGIDQDPTAIFRLTVEAALDNASQASSPLLLTLRTPDGKIYTQGFDGTTWGSWEQIAVESSVTDVDARVDSVESSVADVETSSTASKSYAIGESFYYNDVLLKATAPIPQGGTITPGTNCTPEKIIEKIDDLVSENQTLTNETYNVNDTAITEVASDDLLPIYDTSATGKKKIAVSNFISGLVSNPNILDNPWFTVNQRGFTSGAVINDTYPLDRWKFADNDSNITVSSGTNGLSIVGTPTNTGENLIKQLIEYDRIPNSVGKVITLSAMLADGTVYKSSHVLVSPTSSWQLQAGLDCGTFQVHLLTYGTTPSAFQLFIKSTNEAINATIRAIKLELGSVSTLAQDTAPNYATELLKCQRYFQRVKASNNWTPMFTGLYTNDSVRAILPLLVALRTTPTLSVSDATKLTAYCNGQSAIGASLGVNTYKDNDSKLYLNLTLASGITSANYIAIVFANDADFYIDLSAEL